MDLIVDGFCISRSIETLHELYHRLVSEEDGETEVPRRPNDHSTRQGLTHKPMVETLDVTLTMPVLHQYLTSLNFMEQLCYRLNARDSFTDGEIVWGVGERIGATAKAGIAAAKRSFQANSKPIFGQALDSPNPLGGTSDTGKCRR